MNSEAKHCRACTSTDVELFKIDEQLLYNFNLITNLEAEIGDRLPQKICQSCQESIAMCIDFRNKCIAAELTFLSEKVKFEIEDSTDVVIEESIIKFEDDNRSDIEEANDFMECSTFSDVKSKRKKSKEVENVPRRVSSRKRTPKLNCEKILKQKVRTEPEITVLACGICEKTCDDKQSLQAHVEGHKSGKLSCSTCKEYFAEWPKLMAHRFQHLPKDRIRCHVCSRQFKYEFCFEYHYWMKHSDEKFPGLNCKLCHKVCMTSRKMNQHMRNSHGTKKYICDYCDKVLNTRGGIKTHMKIHANKKNYVCKYCGKAFNVPGGLMVHVLRWHTEGKMTCKFCTRVFRSEAAAQGHACSGGPFVCPVCGRTCLNTRDYKRHERTHQDVRPYGCTRCPSVYKSREALRVHEDRHDGVRRHRCTYCPARFYSQNVLSKHTRTHTGEKPYVCKICNKGFTGGNNLKVHMKVHGEMLVKKKIDEEAR